MNAIWTWSRGLLVVCIGFLIVEACAAQDLGTSNKLFSKKKTAHKRVRKSSKPAKVWAEKRLGAKKQKVSTTKGIPVRIAPREIQTNFDRAPVRIAPRSSREDTKVKPVADSDTFGPAAARQYEQLLVEAEGDLAARNYQAAEITYKRAMDLKRPDARAAMALGGLYSDTERWEAAERTYRVATEREPKNAAAYIGLGYVLMQPVMSGELSERYAEAERMIRKAIGLDGANAVVLDQLGEVLERQGLIGAETEGAYRRSIAIEPAYAPAYAHLERLLSRRGRSFEAADAHVSAWSKANSVQMIIAIARIVISEHRFGVAVPLLQRAVERDPRNASALFLMGRALLGTDRSADAERYLLRSVDVSPLSFAGYNMLGELYLRQDRLDEADRTLQRASSLADVFEKPVLAGQFEDVGDHFLRAGRRADAERAYRKALALDATRRSLSSKIARSRH